jgi:hypothetical protein
LFPSRRIDWPPIAASSLVRSAGQHPPFASLGQIAPGQIGVAAQGIEPTPSPAESAGAASTARAAARTARTTSAAGTARTARTTPTAAAAAIPIASTPIIAARVRIAPSFRPRHHVHHVVKIALLLGVGRWRVARQDTHQAYPGRALANHRERLHQT